ncbi:hypothetical protein NL676_039732 [Syzygium grande]|nr:hypothetical protein NL676_039732 [Syzygium grande]
MVFAISPTAWLHIWLQQHLLQRRQREKGGRCKTQANLMTEFADVTPEAQVATSTRMETVKLGIGVHENDQLTSGLSSSDGCSSHCDRQSHLASDETCESSGEAREQGACQEPISQIAHVEECWWDVAGNFPSPRELARLDECFLAKRCNLGYRAGQIRLRQIDGFGPFTCANVLTCMGFYHAIPTDSETIRHLKQVHGKNSTIQTALSDVDDIYGRYAPFQFLAYWAELWNFYGERFGNLSAMPLSNYKLITATNMKEKGSRRKRG